MFRKQLELRWVVQKILQEVRQAVLSIADASRAEPFR